MANLQILIKESCSDDSKYSKITNPVFKEINEKLKPCPFCGEHVKLTHKDDQFGYGFNGYIIECDSCGIGFYEHTSHWLLFISEKERAKHMRKIIKKWNTRH